MPAQSGRLREGIPTQLRPDDGFQQVPIAAGHVCTGDVHRLAVRFQPRCPARRVAQHVTVAAARPNEAVLTVGMQEVQLCLEVHPRELVAAPPDLPDVPLVELAEYLAFLRNLVGRLLPDGPQKDRQQVVRVVLRDDVRLLLFGKGERMDDVTLRHARLDVAPKGGDPSGEAGLLLWHSGLARQGLLHCEELRFAGFLRQLDDLLHERAPPLGRLLLAAGIQSLSGHVCSVAATSRHAA
eukprot:7062622-Lingulodinium_polyedra.AAC.1